MITRTSPYPEVRSYCFISIRASTGAIKVGDELLHVDGVAVCDRDIPTICAQISDGPDLHVTLTFTAGVGGTSAKNLKDAAAKPPAPYSVVDGVLQCVAV